MNSFSWLALLGFIPISLAIFAQFAPRQAFLWVIFGGVLFLPSASIEIPILADYGKATAPSYAALLGTLIFHPKLIFGFRPRWFDLPMLFWILWQFPPSVANGFGMYDGLSQAVNFSTLWAVPYFLARCYFTCAEHLREVALALVCSGLIYLPLCLFELKMSPCLHMWIYGNYVSPFYDMVRMGGYRPTVFMQHGLMLAFFMCSAAFIAAWLWWFQRDGEIKRIGPFPIGWVATGLVIMAILTRSAGAIMIFAVLAGLVFISQVANWKWILLIPALLMLMYITVRIGGLSDGRIMLDITNQIFSKEHGRQGSLEHRLNQEDEVIPLILQKPWTGWSNWSNGQDQLWLLLARNTGLPSIAAWLLTFSLPLILILTNDLKMQRELFVYGIPLSLVLIGWIMDCFFNGMFNPMWAVIAGAVMTVATSPSITLIWSGGDQEELFLDSNLV